MTAGDFLRDAVRTLQNADIKTARLDVLILLEDVLQLSRAHLLAHPELVLTGAQTAQLNTYIIQRKGHLPLAYIRGEASFYGRSFVVNKQVLVPRPESEALIEIMLEEHDTTPRQIADVGTGSGCLGITAALELPGSTIHFYDIDSDALATANQNAKHYHIEGQYYQSDLFTQYHGPYDIVLANLPYVPDNYPINTAATFEPRLALFSGQDGLDHYRRFWQQLKDQQDKPALIIIEAFPRQHTTLIELASLADYHPKTTKDFAVAFCPKA